MVRRQIASRGVRDPAVIDAMSRLPRERFIPGANCADAYADTAVPLGYGQTISQPFMVAHMTELLRVRPGMNVLEVGTGSGYQCAVLALLGCRVHTVERLAPLAEAAESLLGELQLPLGPVSVHLGDGSLGWPSAAPFDRILLTAGAPQVPQPLIRQLRIGGRLVAPTGPPAGQLVVAVDRLASRTVETPGLACRFVKLIGRHGWRLEPGDPENNASAHR